MRKSKLLREAEAYDRAEAKVRKKYLSGDYDTLSDDELEKKMAKSLYTQVALEKLKQSLADLFAMVVGLPLFLLFLWWLLI